MFGGRCGFGHFVTIALGFWVALYFAFVLLFRILAWLGVDGWL